MLSQNRWVPVVLMGFLVSGACRGGPRAIPAPSPGASKLSNRAVFLGYADSLQFDTSYGIGETRRLMRGNCPGSCSYGPRVRFEPEVGVASLDTITLAHGGRVLGRLVNLDTAVADSYPKFNLRARDTVYWWVDKTNTGFRSLYIPRDSSRAISPPDSFVFHPGGEWHRSWAKYIWRDADEGLWVTCLQGCCKTTSGMP